MTTLELPRGPAGICFDATPLILYADRDCLPWLAAWFQRAYVPEVVTAREVVSHLHDHPKNQEIVDAQWLKAVPVEDEDLKLVLQLRRLWGSAPGRDHGEAEVIALCQRYGWTSIMNDRQGRAAATNYGVPVVSTAGMLVGATASGSIDMQEAWLLHQKIEGGFSRPMILPTTEEFAPAFERAVAATRRLADDDDLSWPELLAVCPLDQLLGRSVARDQR